MSSFPYLDGAGTNVGFNFRRVKDRESPPKLTALCTSDPDFSVATTVVGKLTLTEIVASGCTLKPFNFDFASANQPFFYLPYAGRWRFELQAEYTVASTPIASLSMGIGAPGSPAAITNYLSCPASLPVGSGILRVDSSTVIAAPGNYSFYIAPVGSTLTLNSNAAPNVRLTITYLGVA